MMPHELAFGGILVSPILVAVLGGSVLALLTAWLLNRLNWNVFLRWHQWSFVAFLLIYTCLIGKYGVGL